SELGGVLLPLDGRRDEALRVFQRAQDLIEPLSIAHPESVPIQHELALLLLNIAQIERDEGQPQVAIKNIDRSLAIESQLASEDPLALKPIIYTAKAYGDLGQILSREPEGLDPALAAYQQAVDLLRSVTGNPSELADEHYELASYLGKLGSLQLFAGKLDS